MTTTTRSADTTHFVVPAPGHYGDRARVMSSHYSLAAARRHARPGTGCVVRVGACRRGETWLRVYEETYPVAR